MRIAMVTSRYPYGGAEQVAKLLVEGLSPRHEVFFITTGDEAADHAEDGHRRIVIPLPRFRMLWHHYWNPKVVGALRRLLAEIRPDVAHFHSIANRTFSAQALQTASREFPTVWSLHDMWSQCVWTKTRPPLCRGMTRRCRWCGRMPLLSSVNQRIKERAWEASDLHVILCAEWMRQFLTESALGRKAIHVIPNGVELKRFNGLDGAARRRELGIPADALVVLFAGNMLLPQKGHEELLHAARRIVPARENVWFVFLGHHHPADTGHPRIVVTGPAHPDDMPDYYEAADVFAFPSHVEYAPLVVLEAMAARLPVVTCAVGGIPEQVIEDETGFMIERGDETALEERIVRLLDDGALRRRMGEAARRRVEEEFTLDRQVALTEDVYRQVVAERRQPGGR